MIIENTKENRSYVVAYDAERDEFQIAAGKDFYAGYRVMTYGKASDLVFGTATTENLFDSHIAAESLLHLDRLKTGENVLFVNFEVSLEVNRTQPSLTRITEYLFLDSRVAERED